MPPAELPPVETLDEKDAGEEMRRLAAELAEHDRHYHRDDKPVISDAEYDAMKARYLALEQRFPHLQPEEAPSEKVGAETAAGFAKVTHRLPMLSLDNAFYDDDVREFAVRIRRFLRIADDAELAFTAEPKIDGLSLSLRYEGGRLVTAATRGNGSVGENVTANARTIPDIPQELPADAPEVFEVRGEVYMTRADFAALNERQAERGRQTYVNPRNTAAGSLRQLDPSLTAERALKFFAYAWGEVTPKLPSDTQMGMVGKLRDYGFRTNELMARFISVDELLAHYHEIERQRADLPL
jgi:DNA ligase (NAD+)